MYSMTWGAKAHTTINLWNIDNFLNDFKAEFTGKYGDVKFHTLTPEKLSNQAVP